MAQHKLYGVFYQRPDGVAMWGMARNMRRARRFARHVCGELRAMPLPDPSARAWDAPTFRVLSDLIKDYRPKREREHV